MKFLCIAVLVLGLGCGSDGTSKAFETPDNAGDAGISDASLDMATPIDMTSAPDTATDVSSDLSPDLSELALTGEIGTMSDFVILEENDNVELVSGFQGGWHLEVGFELHGAGLNSSYFVDSEFIAAARHVSSDEQLVNTNLLLSQDYFTEVDSGWALFVPLLIATVEDYPTDWIDTPIELQLSVTLATGQVVTDTVILILVDEVEEIPSG